jgi:hypothetical protein
VRLVESITPADMLAFFGALTGENHELSFLSSAGAIELHFNGYIRRQICATMISVFSGRERPDLSFRFFGEMPRGRRCRLKRERDALTTSEGLRINMDLFEANGREKWYCSGKRGPGNFGCIFSEINIADCESNLEWVNRTGIFREQTWSRGKIKTSNLSGRNGK